MGRLEVQRARYLEIEEVTRALGQALIAAPGTFEEAMSSRLHAHACAPKQGEPLRQSAAMTRIPNSLPEGCFPAGSIRRLAFACPLHEIITPHPLTEPLTRRSEREPNLVAAHPLELRRGSGQFSAA